MSSLLILQVCESPRFLSLHLLMQVAYVIASLSPCNVYWIFAQEGREFCEELAGVFPNATYRDRMKFPVPRIVEFAKNRDFTDVLVFNEDRGVINILSLLSISLNLLIFLNFLSHGALFIHLPDGPTAYFKYVNPSTYLCVEVIACYAGSRVSCGARR